MTFARAEDNGGRRPGDGVDLVPGPAGSVDDLLHLRDPIHGQIPLGRCCQRSVMVPGQRWCHLLPVEVVEGLRLRRDQLRHHAELVAARVRQHHPPDVTLADVHAGRPRRDEPVHLRLLVTELTRVGSPSARYDI
jgi:hypothetical protein